MRTLDELALLSYSIVFNFYIYNGNDYLFTSHVFINIDSKIPYTVLRLNNLFLAFNIEVCKLFNFSEWPKKLTLSCLNVKIIYYQLARLSMTPLLQTIL